MAFSAGTAWLTVLPSFENVSSAFEKEVAKMGRQLDAAIAKSVSKGIQDGAADAQTQGSKAGDQFGNQFSAAAKKGLKDAKDELGRLGVDDARKGGDKAGGAFADAFNNRLKKGAEKLPDIKINADSTDAEVAIAAVRRELLELSDRTVGVDIDEGAAAAKLEDLKRRLDALSRDDASIRIRTEAGEALAVLTEVRALEEAVNRSGPTVKVKSEGGDGAVRTLQDLTDAAGVSSSRIGFLIAIGASLGAAIIPAAAAAAVAIGAIGAAAGAAASGLGVAILGFSGISGAVTALDKAQSASAKSAASLDKAQNSVASSTDQVASAERSLANTQDSVASGARRAAQTVVDAQRSVVDAQREAARVQKDLTKAYEDARRAAQDQAFSIRDNALAQRQANLDIADAKKALDAIVANPRATLAEREQAKITFEQRVLQLDELRTKQTRLTADKAEADKKGVAGSDQVVAAQEKIRAAAENIAKAQQHVADAIQSQKDQQRQGSFQIQQAQQAVVSAMRASQNAAVTAGVAGGAALQNMRQAMDLLGPSGQRFALFLFGLKRPLLDLRNVAQAGLLPGVQQAITSLFPFLGRFRSFVGNVASTLGDLFVKTIDELQRPAWREFFGFLGSTAVPTLRGMFTFVTNVARGVASLVVALSAFNTDIGSGLLRMSEAFASWAERLKDTAGFRNFLAYVRVAGPAVVDLFKQLGIFVARFVDAAAPVGLAVVQGVAAFVGWVNRLPLNILRVVVLAIAAFASGLLVATAAVKAFTVAADARKALMLAWTFITDAYAKATNRLNTAMSGGVQASTGFGFQLGQVAAHTSTAEASATKLTGTLSGLRNAMSSINSMATGGVARLATALTTSTGQIGVVPKLGEVVSDAAQNSLARYTASITTATGQVGLFARVHEVAMNAIGATTRAVSTAVGGAAGAMGRFGQAISTGIGGAVSGVSRGVTGLIGALGGPWVLAITAAIAAVGFFAAKSAEQKQKVDALAGALLALGGAYRQNHDLTSQSIKDIILGNAALTDLIRQTDLYGLSVEQVTRATAGDHIAQQQVLAALREQQKILQDRLLNEKGTAQGIADKKRLDAINTQIEALDKEFAQLNKNDQAAAKLAGSQDKLKKSISDVTDAFAGGVTNADVFKAAISALSDAALDSDGKVGGLAAIAGQVADSHVNAAQKADLFRSVLGEIGNAATTNGPVFDALSGVFTNIAGSALSARDKTDLLKQSLDQLYGAAISQAEADEAMVASQTRLTTQLGTNSAGFDLNTARTSANKDAILQNRDALEAALQATRDKYVADIAQGISEEAARANHDKTTVSILGQIDPVNRNSAAVRDLVQRYGDIPPSKRTDVTTPGLDTAIDDLITAHAVQVGLSQHPPWNRDQIKSEANFLRLGVEGRSGTTAAFKAEGGPIGGWSPHSKADNIPAWLTAGEWVHPVDSVQYYGTEVMEALRQRAIPREILGGPGVHRANGGPIPGYAQGGQATWPIEIPTSIDMPVSLAQLWAQYNAALAALSTAGTAGGGTIPANVAANLTAWIAAAVQIAGVPANWGGGPGQIGLWTLVMRESGGNPNAINLTDSNAAAGHPSIGLAQTIGPTFEHYRDKRLPDNIRDPVANLVAALNYIKSRYGSIFNVQQANPNRAPLGYAAGGPVQPLVLDQGGMLQPGWNPPVFNGTGRVEPVLNPTQWDDISQLAGHTGATGGNQYNFAFRDTDLTAGRLRAMQDRDAVLARIGRAR